ncbi:MAG: hypothetical protein AAFO95_06130 [Cyanobacteria bacterium J06600_6]
MSILSTSPTSTRHFDMNIAAALGDINAAVIIQQLDYWLKKEGVGTVIEGRKYIYNTFVDWVNSQFKWLSVWQFRKAMALLRSLSIVKVIRYKSKEWNQTNYYSLDRDRLAEFLNQEIAESTETVEMCVSSSQGEESLTLEMRDSKLSYIETKKNTKKETAKQLSDRLSNKSNSIAAASPKTALEEKKSQTDRNPHSSGATASPSQKKQESDSNKSNLDKETKLAKVDYTVNKDYKSLISLLDSTGIPINRTIKDLLKLYPSEKVEGAIAVLKARKRDQYIPNPSGYFVAALKGDWGSENISVEGSGDRFSSEIDKKAVFRHWYDLAKQLGYCSGQEIRDGMQWICLSGAWEKWETAVNRGYSLEYLKKIMKRNSKK